MEWRSIDSSLDELTYWKDQLAKEFNYPITCFVAPSNKITRKGIQAVYKSGMNYSGIVPIDFQRDVTIRNIVSYLKRWILRATTGFPYPGILRYSSHKEINACTLVGYDYLIRLYEYCCKIGSPMAINVHYWHLRDNPDILDDLVKFVKYAIANGARPSKLTDCL